MRTLLTAFAIVALTGCGSIIHKRPVVIDGKIAYEIEEAHGFFQKAAFENLVTTTKDKDYSHSFRAKGGSVAGDAATITASGEALGNLIGAAAATAAKSTVKP